jgi:peptidoglycan/xylan/chitin deacetylase (PgdA/CDA1 family)
MKALVGRLQTSARRLVRRVPAGTLVLLYHRVATPAVDPWRQSVSPAHFAEHMAVLKREAKPMQLRALRTALRTGKTPRDGVVVTFDDGYADNLLAARPILDRHDVPATIFVTSGALGTPAFWWDRLARLLLRPGKLPKKLSLPVPGRTHQVKLGQDAEWDDAAAAAHPSWTPWGEEHPTARHRAYRTFYDALLALDAEQRQKALAALPAVAESQADRPLSIGELRTLAENDLIEIGCHTRTHPVLSRLASEAQRDEIRLARRDLGAVIGTPLTSFAYPFGRPEDYDAGTVKLVREAGFSCACSNFASPVGSGADPFQIPRFEVRDWDGDGFAAALRAWRVGDPPPDCNA